MFRGHLHAVNVPLEPLSPGPAQLIVKTVLRVDSRAGREKSCAMTVKQTPIRLPKVVFLASTVLLQMLRRKVLLPASLRLRIITWIQFLVTQFAVRKMLGATAAKRCPVH